MRTACLLLVTLTVAVAISAPAYGEVVAKPFEHPYHVTVYDLPVSSNGVRYRLYVRPPLQEPADGEGAAAVYFLDAIANFVPAAAMTASYERFNYTPAAYFIGIGYQDESDGVPKEYNRTRDYTPTRFTPPDQNHFLAASPDSYKRSG
ncbi:MAG: hypothetical protein P8Z33_09695 [Gammaproteobacteria bacterium]|jgi:uncharacterized protein